MQLYSITKYRIGEWFDGFTSTFASTTNFVLASLDDIKSDLSLLVEYLEQANNYYPKHFSWAYWVAAGASIGLAVVCLYLLAIVIRLLCCTETEMTTEEAKDDKSVDPAATTNNNGVLPVPIKGLRSWLVLPTFIVFALISWMFSMIFITGSIGTSDFCVNSPDGPMMSILNNNMKPNFSSETSLVASFLSYYIQGCPSIAPFGGAGEDDNSEIGIVSSFTVDAGIFELEQRVGILSRSILPAMRSLEQVLDSEQAQNEMQSVCDINLLPFLAITRSLQSQFCSLTQTLVS